MVLPELHKKFFGIYFGGVFVLKVNRHSIAFNALTRKHGTVNLKRDTVRAKKMQSLDFPRTFRQLGVSCRIMTSGPGLRTTEEWSRSCTGDSAVPAPQQLPPAQLI